MRLSSSQAMDEGRRDMPKEESLAEHLTHCKAKNCPFLKVDKMDMVDSKKGSDDGDVLLVTAVENGKKKTVEIDTGKKNGSDAIEKLATAMSELWQYSESMDTNKEDESIVKAVIESGLSAMHDELDENSCITKTDDKTANVVIIPPQAE